MQVLLLRLLLHLRASRHVTREGCSVLGVAHIAMPSVVLFTDGDWRLAAPTAGQLSVLRAPSPGLISGLAIFTFHRKFVFNVL